MKADLPLGFLACIFIAGCTEPYRNYKAPAIRAKLEVLKPLGTSSDSRAPVTVTAALPLAKPLLLCPLDGTPGHRCNAIAVRPETLQNPTKLRLHDDYGEGVSCHGGVLANAAQILADGTVISEEYGPNSTYDDLPIRQGWKGTRFWFDAFERVDYVLVVHGKYGYGLGRGGTANRSYEASIYVHDAHTGASLGGMRVEAECEDVSKVYVNGPHAGESAGSTSCLYNTTKTAFLRELGKAGGTVER